MNDKEFLQWMHNRLVEVHRVNENFDYMHKLRAIIARTPEDQRSPNVVSKWVRPSPCIGMCTATALGDPICAGCGRTAEEVRDWNQYTDEQKRTITLRLEARP